MDLKSIGAAVAFTAASMFAGAAAQAATTLETVKANGYVRCGVNTGVAGFSMPDKDGNWKGIDIDLCRAVAAAVLGDAGKAKFIPYTAQQRFTALQSGEVDMLVRNSTVTQSRDTGLGLSYAGINFYDGQGFMVARRLNVTSLKQLDGATICVAQGTTHESNMADWFRTNKLSFKPVVIENQDQLYAAFFSGRCDAITQDGSALAAALVSAVTNPGDYLILPERISKEPLGPFLRQGDEQWSKIVRWVLMAMIEAEEFNMTQATVDNALKSTDPEVQRFLGLVPGLGKNLGLEETWAYNVVKQVGSYGESYDRNVGKASPLKLERGLNDLWTRGGLMYAMPMR